MAWTERYRPRRLEGISFQDHVVDFLTAQLKTPATMPHLLLHGPPGSGKTSTALAICHELFGEAFRDRVLELNASHQRGIDTIREKVHHFAQSQCVEVTQETRQDRDHKGAAFKVILLDEADALTKDAQTALRFIIEKYALHTRFVLICNRLDCLIEPLQSRCVKMCFQALDADAVFATLQVIAKKETMTITPAALRLVATISDGDLRRAIHLLQEAAFQQTSTPSTPPTPSTASIDERLIEEVADLIPVRFLDTYLTSAESDDLPQAFALFHSLLAAGHPADTFFQQLQTHVLQRAPLKWKSQEMVSATELSCNSGVLCDPSDLPFPEGAEPAFLSLWSAEAFAALRGGANALLQLSKVWCRYRRLCAHAENRKALSLEKTQVKARGVDRENSTAVGRPETRKNFLNFI